MTEPTKEQAWKEEARKAYQDQQSQDIEGGCREPIGFVQGYLAAKKSDFEELQKTREQLNKVEELLRKLTESAESLMTLGDRYTEHGQNIVDTWQYFKDKDKQGE